MTFDEVLDAFAKYKKEIYEEISDVVGIDVDTLLYTTLYNENPINPSSKVLEYHDFILKAKIRPKNLKISLPLRIYNDMIDPKREKWIKNKNWITMCIEKGSVTVPNLTKKRLVKHPPVKLDEEGK